MENLSKIQYEKLLKEDRIIIDFSADWCGPCRMLSPIFEELSKSIKEIKFGKINVDNEQEIAKSNNVGSIPTLIIFEKGKEVKRHSGFMSKENLIEFIKK